MSDQKVFTGTNKKPNAKHVSKACLECRHRHLKCGGQLPKCARCVSLNKECSYVKSNRGGSRKKGVKKAKLNPEISDEISIESEFAFPCNESGNLGVNCPDGHDENSCGFLKDRNLTELPCHRKGDTSNNNIFIEKNKISSSTTRFLDQEFDINQIVETYFATFHRTHPIVAPLHEVNQFLELSGYPKELIGVMKVIGDGYISSKYSKNINEVFEIATEILDLINSIPKDVITLHVLILLSLVCHISSLHDMSTSLRKQAIELTIHLDLNNLDSDDFTGEDLNGNIARKPPTENVLTPKESEEININFNNTKRVRNLPNGMLKESARRCFWELFFLDIITGSSDGKTLSKLTSVNCFVLFPLSPSKQEFDYETRSYTSKLVDDAVRLNNIIFSEKSIGHHYSKLTASLSNWELKLSNPDFYRLPYLIDSNGIVNEGIQQGLIMLNYAKIFTHRPLSFLWRSDIPQNLKCVELLNSQLNKNENCQDLPNEKDLINSRKIIETRKTIDAANLIAKTLIDTNPVNILQRTPLNACSLAFAGLVHLSSYLWSSQVAQANDSNNSALHTDDLNMYEEYMKLEFSGIYQISSHWYLSSKIANYLMESISKLVPNLFIKMQSHFKDQLPLKLLQKHQNKSTKSKPKIEDHTTVINNLNKSNQSVSTPSTETGTDQLSEALNKQLGSTDGFLETTMSYSIPDASSSSELFKFGEPDSPQSDTGCEWIDNNQLDFDFANYNFVDFDFDVLGSVDDFVNKQPSSSLNDISSR